MTIDAILLNTVEVTKWESCQYTNPLTDRIGHAFVRISNSDGNQKSLLDTSTQNGHLYLDLHLKEIQIKDGATIKWRGVITNFMPVATLSEAHIDIEAINYLEEPEHTEISITCIGTKKYDAALNLDVTNSKPHVYAPAERDGHPTGETDYELSGMITEDPTDADITDDDGHANWGVNDYQTGYSCHITKNLVRNVDSITYSASSFTGFGIDYDHSVAAYLKSTRVRSGYGVGHAVYKGAGDDADTEAEQIRYTLDFTLKGVTRADITAIRVRYKVKMATETSSGVIYIQDKDDTSYDSLRTFTNTTDRVWNTGTHEIDVTAGGNPEYVDGGNDNLVRLKFRSGQTTPPFFLGLLFLEIDWCEVEYIVKSVPSLTKDIASNTATVLTLAADLSASAQRADFFQIIETPDSVFKNVVGALTGWNGVAYTTGNVDAPTKISTRSWEKLKSTRVLRDLSFDTGFDFWLDQLDFYFKSISDAAADHTLTEDTDLIYSINGSAARIYNRVRVVYGDNQEVQVTDTDSVTAYGKTLDAPKISRPDIQARSIAEDLGNASLEQHRFAQESYNIRLPYSTANAWKLGEIIELTAPTQNISAQKLAIKFMLVTAHESGLSYVDIVAAKVGSRVQASYDTTGSELLDLKIALADQDRRVRYLETKRAHPPVDHLFHSILLELDGGGYKLGGHNYAIRRQISANADPTITDDLDTYPLGTVWIREDTDEMWILMDNTDGAAVWVKMASVDYVDSAAHGTLEYSLDDDASDIGGVYKVMYEGTGNIGAKATIVDAVVADEDEIGIFATISGEPHLTILHAGVYTINLHAENHQLPGTKDVAIYGEIFSRTDPGGVETLRITTETSPVLTAAETHYSLHGVLTEDVVLNATDRLVIKISGTVTGAGNDPGVTLSYEGTTSARLEFSAPASILISDAAFAAGWNGDTLHAASKNAIYDEMVTKAVIATGNYTGNGVNNRQITGVGFDPKIVWVTRATGGRWMKNDQYPEWKASWSVNGSVVDDSIKLIADGFETANDANDWGNINGTDYYWTAIG